MRRWKEFQVVPPGTRTGLYASINPEGRIAINQRAWEALSSPRFVSLFVDDLSPTIGIRAVSELMPNSFPVVPVTPAKKRFWIRAYYFIKAARLDISYTVRFIDPEMEDKTLTLDLDRTARIHASRRRK